MTATSWLVAFCVSAALIWLIHFVLVLLLVIRPRRAIQLATLPDDPPPGGWSSLAVIFAARNEEKEVEAAVRSMLAQDYPGLEFIAVDDRSTDATGQILDRVASEDRRLHVVHVTELPPGWLGKNHALQSAAECTEADWILFTDADVVFAPGTLRRAVSWAERNGVDHLTVAPEVPTESIGERLILAMFGLLFLLNAPLWRLENRRKSAYLGIGAFNLVRSEAFRAIGGLKRLALSIDDDMRLGQALKAAGFTPRFLLGKGALRVRWHVGLSGIVRGLEKNFFAVLDFQVGKVAAAVLVVTWLGVGPHLGLFVGPVWSRVVCGLAVLALLYLVGRTAWQSRIAWYYGLLLPLGALFCDLAILRSTWLTLAQRGVRWRDHHYPLPELRSHARRRNAWTREVWKSTR